MLVAALADVSGNIRKIHSWLARHEILPVPGLKLS